MRYLLLLAGACVMLVGMFAPRGESAGTDWRAEGVTYTHWIRPIAAQYGTSLYVCGVDRDGNQKVARFKNGNATEFTLGTATVSDDHNAPSITRLANGKLLAVYSRHGQDTTLRYRISSSADDISAWAAEQTLTSTGDVSYSQCWVDSTGRVHVFYRSDADRWAHRYSDDHAATWSSEKIVLDTGTGELVYMLTQPASADLLRVAMIGNPASGTQHNIYYGEIDLSTGDCSQPGGASLVNLYDASAAAAPSAFELVYDAATAGTNARLFDIGTDTDPQVLFATFTDASGANYREARRVGGTWTVSGTIATSGPPIENPVGTNYYYAGMAATGDVDTVYLSRQKTDGDWPLEKWVNSGGWALDTTVLAGDWRLYKETYRPVVPYGATTTPVIAMQGEYIEYSGAADHSNFSTDVIFDSAQEPVFSETELYAEAFTGLTPGAAVAGWSVLAKSTGVTGETFTAQTGSAYLGGVFGRMLSTDAAGASTVFWGRTGSSVQDLVMRADIRGAQNNSIPGFVARWQDSNNRVELYLDQFNGLLVLRERNAGTFGTSSVAAVVPQQSLVRLELSLNGTTAIGRLYRAGVLVAEVNRTLTGTPAAGAYGLKSDKNGGGSTTHTHVQRMLVVTP